MENWKEIWERKGLEDTDDLRKLDGSERHPIGLDKKIVEGIISRLDLTPNQRVLEVGCGAGMLAQHFRNFNYQGVDQSNSLIRKHKKIIGGNPLVAPANKLPFQNSYFDAVFSWGVFLYFPDSEYARETIKEMRRVCKEPKKVYLGDLPINSHRDSHLLFSPKDFSGELFPGFWLGNGEEERFDVVLKDVENPYAPEK